MYKYIIILAISLALFASCTKQPTPEPCHQDDPVTHAVDLNNTEWVNIDSALYGTYKTVLVFDNGGGSSIYTDGESFHIEWRIEAGQVYVYIPGWHMPIDEAWYGDFTKDGILFNNGLLFTKQ